MLASHHGASTHGSNSQEWLDLTQPKYILISNGLSYGHPSKEAYKRFHEPVKNNSVKRHDVLVGKAVKKGEGESYKEGTLHKTKAAIFSTLTSGTITVNCMETGFKISTVVDNDVDLEEEKSKSIVESDEEKDEEVSVRENDNDILLTPKPSRPKNLNSDAVPPPFIEDLSGENSGDEDIDAGKVPIVAPKVAAYPKTNGGFLSFLRDKGYTFDKIAQEVSPKTYTFTPEKLTKIAEGLLKLPEEPNRRLNKLLIEKFPNEWGEFQQIQ